ncbi:MAG: DoxX family protein [Chitinophagaceae bacterium]|nr:DoxX family protein [Chitinophagaceae bacterium]
MKRFLSTNYSDTAFNIALLILRAGMGVLLFPYGYQKLVHFADRKNTFTNFLGMGSTISLSLVIFAEVICAGLLIIGLFSRFASLVLVILTAVIVFKIDKGDIFGKGEDAMLYLLGFFTVLLVGPGKYSTDAAMGR